MERRLSYQVQYASSGYLLCSMHQALYLHFVLCLLLNTFDQPQSRWVWVYFLSFMGQF